MQERAGNRPPLFIPTMNTTPRQPGVPTFSSPGPPPRQLAFQAQQTPVNSKLIATSSQEPESNPLPAQVTDMLCGDTAGCQGPSETEGLGPSIVGMGVEGI